MNCDFGKQFRKDFSKLIATIKKGKTSDEQKSEVLRYLKEAKQKALDAGYSDITPFLEQWSDFVVNMSNKFCNLTLNKLSVQDILLNPEKANSLEAKVNNTTTSLDTTMQSKQDFRKDFLERIYYGIENARIQVTKDVDFNLAKALIFDRDKGTITHNEKEFNANLKEYQSELFEDLKEYLKSQNLDVEDTPLYDAEGKYTGAFDKLFPIASNLFNSFNKARISAEFSYQTPGFKAFNAYQTLLHFDEFLLSSFGDTVNISDFSTRFDKTYLINSKATNMFWNNQADDDIDVTKSVNNISKLIVNSTRRRDIHGNIIPNSYINYGQFITTITKLKDLAWNQQLAQTYKLNLITGGTYQYKLENLSPENRAWIRSLGPDATIGTVINNIFMRPRLASSSLFELMSLEYQSFPAIWSTFTPDEKQFIVSLGYELFNHKGNSLANVQEDWDVDYYNYILQTFGTNWSVRNCQYVEDPETGQTVVRALSGNSIYKVQRGLNDAINILNSPNLVKDKYNCQYNNKEFSFRLGNHTIKETSTGRITIDGRAYNKDLEDEVITFIDDMLHQNFKNNPVYLSNFISLNINGTRNKAIASLFEFSVGVLHGQFAARMAAGEVKAKPEENKAAQLEREANKYWPSDQGEKKVNFNYRNIDIIPTKKLTTLSQLAEAKSITEGITSTTQINDSQGKAISTATPSRLMSTFQQQFEIIRKAVNSPAHHFQIINNPNLLLDVQSVREFKPAIKDAKKYNSLNTREFLESAILFDFLGPLVQDERKYNLFSKGVIGTLQSVNSDKSTVAKLSVNLKELMSLINPSETSVDKFVTDESYLQPIYDLTAKELGTYYGKMLHKINEDLATISKTRIWADTIGSDFILNYSEASFNEFNERIAKHNGEVFTTKEGNYLNARSIFDAASKEAGVIIHEPIHVTFTKAGTIAVDYSLVSLNARYNNLTEGTTIPSYAEFTSLKNSELLRDLLINQVKLDITNNKQLYKYLVDNGLGDWISDAGTLTFAKWSGGDLNNDLDLNRFLQANPEVLEHLRETSSDPTIETLKYNIHLIKDQIKLNPLLEKYNAISHLMNQEYLCSTVGSHINHPVKKVKSGLVTEEEWLQDESARFNAQHKRNVSQTASMHIFLLKQLNGIPTYYNIANIQDIKDLVFNIGGDLAEVKPFDGATFVDPIIVHLENNSLNGERAGNHKKQFVHFYDESTGTGGIIKTAGFGLNNSWMRQSPFLERMFMKMENRPFSEVVNITKSQTGINGELKPIDYGEFYYKVPTLVEDVFGENKWQNKFFKVTDIKSVGNNANGWPIYEETVVEVDKKGNPIGLPQTRTITDENGLPVQADTNYKVWKYIFKGLDSCSKNDKGELSYKGKYGETSVKLLVDAVNKVGRLLSGTKPVDQDNFYQPMKYSGIHYIPTEGAVKQGIANYNESGRYYSKEVDLNSFKIYMGHAGIQLDKEHNAADEEIAMMTQVISAAAALGYSWDNSNKLYRALESLTMHGIESITEPLQELLTAKNSNEYDKAAAQFKFNKVLAGLIIKQLANGSSTKDGVVYNIAYELIDKYRKGEQLQDKDFRQNPLPVSDPNLFNKISSMLSSILTNSAIRMKFKGVLSVLVPSHEIMKIYGGKLKNDFINFEEEIKELQAQQPMLDISQVQMGRSYIIYDGTSEPKHYLVKAPMLPEKVGTYGNPDEQYIGYYDLRNELLQHPDWQIQEDVTKGRNLAAYFCTFEDSNGNKYNFYDLADSYNLYHGAGSKQNLQETLAKLKNGETVQVNVDGVIQDVQVNNLQVQPYEIIMPKTFAKQLNLTEEDNLSELYNDKDSFTKKLINNLKPRILDENYYTAVLKRLNGDHLYILTTEQAKNLSGLMEIQSYPPVIDPVTGKIHRVDSEGEELYQMSSINDKVYVVDGQEVIVTDDLDFYLTNTNYNLLTFSNKVSADVLETVGEIKSKNKALKNWQYITKGKRKQINGRLNQLALMPNGTLNVPQLDSYIKSLGSELYTSFRESLDIIAARIPAQSMQSFMPMRCVGFEEFDANTAYVSSHQIWLQGSDYDIDCVSLLTYELLSNGKFAGWSPLFDLSSHEAFETSCKLNYPSGEKVKLEKQLKAESKDQVIAYVQNLFRPFTTSQLKIGEDGKPVVGNDGNPTQEVRLLDDKDGLRIGDFNALVELVNSTTSIWDFDSNPRIFTNIFNHIFGTSKTEEEVKKLWESVINDYIDAHNLYNQNKESYTKNFIVYQLQQVAKSPANLIQAQTSVDKTTDIPKDLTKNSPAAALLNDATPGNFANMYQAIEDNYVGKEVIGISAVGLKSFFAITQYVNTILRSGNTEDIENLVSKPITFNGKTYYSIANANYSGENLDILNKLAQGNGQDAALMLSALLSLATDNAKELCLSKLNANSKLAGMYIYGLSMGVSYQELGQLLMSDFGNMVTSLLKGSVISDRLGLNNVGNILDYLKDPVTKTRTAYTSLSIQEFSDSRKAMVNVPVQNVFRSMFGITAGGTITMGNKTFNKNGKQSWKAWLDQSVKSLDNAFSNGQPQFVLDDILMSLDAAAEWAVQHKGLVKGKAMPYNKYVINQYRDALKQAFIHQFQARLHMDQMSDFTTLYEGAEELKVLGQLLGANQGIKNSMEDYLKYINALENCTKNHAKVVGKRGSKFTAEDFLNDPQTQIEEYFKVMTSFNPLHIINTVPHYKGYLTTVVKKHQIMKEESYKYRGVYNNLDKVKEVVGTVKLDQAIKGLSNLFDFKIINDFLAKKSFTLPTGGEIVTLNSMFESKKVKTNRPTTIFLGTLTGNATFKNWMEQTVIPLLKEGYRSESKAYKNETLASNKFIQSLRPNMYTLTNTKNPSMSMTTSINMSPRTDEDKLSLLQLRSEFDSLSIPFELEDGSRIPIKDLFYYYNLITYGGKGGQSTLTSIFDNYITSSLPKEFFNNTKELDESNNQGEASDLLIKSYVSQIESPFAAYSSSIYYKNKRAMEVQLLEKPSNEEDESIPDEEQELIGKYEASPGTPNLDFNLIMSRPGQEDVEGTINIPGGATIKFKPETREITNIIHPDVTFTKEELKAISDGGYIVKYGDHGYQVDQSAVESLIEHKLNCE